MRRVWVGILAVVAVLCLLWIVAHRRRTEPSPAVVSVSARPHQEGAFTPMDRHLDDESSRAYALRGWAVSSLDHEGIPWVHVVLRAIGGPSPRVGAAALPRITPSDSEGRWSFEGLAAGRYTLTASARGYLPHRQLSITLSDGLEPTELRLTLTPGGHTMRGHVMDTGGGPVEGAWVRGTEEGHEDEVFAAVTDSEGHYELTLPDGYFSIATWHDDYETVRQSVIMRGNDRTLDFEVTPGASISGRVLTREGGEGVAQATVFFDRKTRYGGSYSMSGSVAESEAMTDSNGAFSLSRLASAEYSLSARATRFASSVPIEISLGVAEQAATVVILVDPAFRAVGQVVDRSDRSSGVEGVFVDASNHAGTSRRAKTDATGAFVLEGLLPSLYSVSLRGARIIDNLTGPRLEIADEDLTGLVFEVERGSTVHGQVQPPGPAQVAVRVRNSTGSLSMAQSSQLAGAMALSGADGTFEIHTVPVGDWMIVAEGVDGSRGQVDVSVPEGVLEGIVVHCEPRLRIEGRVVDRNGASIARARVKLTDERDTTPFGGQRIEADENGTFEFVGLEPGRFTLSVMTRGGVLLQPVRAESEASGFTIELGSTNPAPFVDLVVERPNGTIAGTVRSSDGSPHADAWVTLDQSVGSMEWALGEGGLPRTISDADGRFRFDELVHTDYTLHARSRSGDAEARLTPVHLGDQPVLVLEPRGVIAGRVTAGGVPVARFEIQGESGSDRIRRSFVSDDGMFELSRIASGLLSLSVVAQAGAWTDRIDVPPGKTTSIAIDLRPWGKIEGRVVDPEGNPLPGVGVSIVAGGGERDRTRRWLATVANVHEVRTHSDGRFAIDGVGEGVTEVTLHPGGEGHAVKGRVTVSIRSGQTTDVGDLVVWPASDVPNDAQR